MKNSYRIDGGEVKVFFKNSHKFTVVDAVDLQLINSISGYWHTSSCKNTGRSYVYGYLGGMKILLHRLLLFGTCHNDLMVDHADHDTLNNRRSNLRAVTNSQNQQNRFGHQRNNKSGIRGVSWHKRTQKWRVQVGVCGKQTHVGYFADIESARQAADDARKRHGFVAGRKE